MHDPRHQTSAEPKHAQRDEAILDHVGRFRLTTNEIVARLFFRGHGMGAVRKVMSRLCACQQLCQFELRHPRVYYVLGRRAVAERGLPAHRTWPLGPQSLAMHYAVLAYSTLGSRYHRRLTREELIREWQWPVSSSSHPVCCVDSSPLGRVLELLRIDLGARADHVARKSERLIDAFVHDPHVDELIRSRRMRLVIVTASESKTESIRRSLDRHVWPLGLELHLAVVRPLLDFFKKGSFDA